MVQTTLPTTIAVGKMLQLTYFWTHSLVATHVQTNRVVHRMSQGLLGSKVTFGRLDRCTPKQKLDLFEITASLPAEFRTVRRRSCGASFPRSETLAYRITSSQTVFSSRISVPASSAALLTGLKRRSSVIPDASSQASMRVFAGQHSDGPNPIALPCHVGQHPAAFPLLQVFEVDAKQLSPAQPTTEQQG